MYWCRIAHCSQSLCIFSRFRQFSSIFFDHFRQYRRQLWHWLIRLFRNFVTCKDFPFTIKPFLIVLSALFLNFKLIFTDECVLFPRFSVRVNQIDSRANVKWLYVSISFWNSCIESLYKAISTLCTIRSNHTSSSWIDLNENSLSQIDWHWISWFAVFFFETVKTMLFSVLDKLIIVIKMSIFSSLNLLFILSLHSDELISVTKLFENMIILRLFHWIVSFSFAVWALIFWFAILVVFLLTTFAHVEEIDDEEIDVEAFSTLVWVFSDDCDFFTAWILLERWEFFFEFDIAAVDLIKEFFESFTRFSDRDWFERLFNRSMINFVIFCFIVFSNCWKFSDIVSLYDVVVVFDFLIKSIDANSKIFSVCIWSIATDTSSVKSRFVLARSIWLIRFCIVTCSIFAIFRSSNKFFAHFLVSRLLTIQA
jgi:hypothetical protein